MTSSAAGVPLERLVEHRDFVRCLARSLVRDPNRADDLEQDVWATALAHPPRHEDGLRGWLRRIARSRAVDAARGANRREALVAGAARAVTGRGTPGPAELAARLDAGRRVARAVSALEEPYRGVVLLRFYEDLEPSEISARTGVPLETVRTRLRRAIERVRTELDAGPGGREAWMAALVPLAWPAGAATGGAGAAAGSGAGAGGATCAGTSGWVAGGVAMSAKSTIGAAAMAAAAGAVIGSAVTLGAAMPTAAPVPIDVATATETKELRKRLDAAETRLAQVAASNARAGDARLAEHERRVAELESAIATLRESAASSAAPPIPRSERDARRADGGGDRAGTSNPVGTAPRATPAVADVKPEKTLADLRRRLADTSLPEAERLEALTALRAMPGGIDAAAVDAAAGLYRTTAAPATRVSILRDLHRRFEGAAATDAKRLFLEGLGDADESVRERAAEDADTWVADPEIRAALENAKSNDASDSVRRRAERTLRDAK